ncbi:hypothetical protein GCAAIG_05115 [Candidatus Electronema halotolerans]
MFNFKELKLNKKANETDPFVGIRRSTSGEMEFRLPRGFADFPENDFNETKKLFFRMYRTFKKFERDHSGRYIDKTQGRRDNIEKLHDGYSFQDSEGSEVVLYSKISVIENLLEAYNDLSLDVIERQIGIDEKIDYSKIDKYLDKAIYQEENIDEYVIYIDSMELPKNVIQYKSATLIDMFCFILHEVNKELDQGTDSRVRELSVKFKEECLSCDQSIFHEDTFEETIITLKDLLHNIDKSTAYKDNDYWRLYEAIESFLYGELDMNNPHVDGVFWGISNFYQIWEDMCNTYIIANDYNVLYIDKEMNGKNERSDINNRFSVDFRDKSRYIKPDIIYSFVELSFPEFIKIELINDWKVRVDFSIELIDSSSKKNRKKYKNWCSKLREKSSGFRPERVNENKMIFKLYPKDTYTSFNAYLGNFTESIFLTDWKYFDLSFFFKRSKKLDTDITKQLCYEFCLKKDGDINKLYNQLVIPFFYSNNISYRSEEDKIGFRENSEKLYNRLPKSKIDLFKANFYTMQKAYLNYD